MINKDEMHDVVRDETQKVVKAAIVGAAEMERRKRKKERRKKFYKFLGKCLSIGALVGIGYIIGAHRELVIKYVKRYKFPKCVYKLVDKSVRYAQKHY